MAHKEKKLTLGLARRPLQQHKEVNILTQSSLQLADFCLDGLSVRTPALSLSCVAVGLIHLCFLEITFASWTNGFCSPWFNGIKNVFFPGKY